jgi:uncharacterized YccA/Bax inhibitor family protein
MSNPILNEKAAAEAARSGWAAPQPSGRSTPLGPIDDGPISNWQSSNVMTIAGTATATGVLLVILLAAASVGWVTGPSRDGSDAASRCWPSAACSSASSAASWSASSPPWPHPRPHLCGGHGLLPRRHLEGVQQLPDGIVVQAIGATLAVFAVMLFLYKSRIIKVTERYRRIVIMATMGLMLFYAVSFVISLFGARVPFINDASPLGIGFSLLAAGLAAA